MMNLVRTKYSKHIFNTLISLRTSVQMLKQISEKSVLLRSITLKKREVTKISDLIFGHSVRTIKPPPDRATQKIDYFPDYPLVLDLKPILRDIMPNFPENGLLGFDIGYGRTKMSDKLLNWITEKHMELSYIAKHKKKLKKRQKKIFKKNSQSFNGQFITADAFVWRMMKFKMDLDIKYEFKRVQAQVTNMLKYKTYILKKFKKLKTKKKRKGAKTFNKLSYSFKMFTGGLKFKSDFGGEYKLYMNSLDKGADENFPWRRKIESASQSSNTSVTEFYDTTNDKRSFKSVMKSGKKDQNREGIETGFLTTFDDSLHSERPVGDIDIESIRREDPPYGVTPDETFDFNYFNDTFSNSLFQHSEIPEKTLHLTLYGLLSPALVADGSSLVLSLKFERQRHQAVRKWKEQKNVNLISKTEAFERRRKRIEKKQQILRLSLTQSNLERFNRKSLSALTKNFMNTKMAVKELMSRHRRRSVMKLKNVEGSDYDFRKLLQKTYVMEKRKKELKELEELQNLGSSASEDSEDDSKDEDSLLNLEKMDKKIKELEKKSLLQENRKSFRELVNEVGDLELDIEMINGASKSPNNLLPPALHGDESFGEVSTPSNITGRPTPSGMSSAKSMDSFEHFMNYEEMLRAEAVNREKRRKRKVRLLKVQKKALRKKEVSRHNQPIYCLVHHVDEGLGMAKVMPLVGKEDIQEGEVYSVDMEHLIIFPQEHMMDKVLEFDEMSDADYEKLLKLEIKKNDAEDQEIERKIVERFEEANKQKMTEIQKFRKVDAEILAESKAVIRKPTISSSSLIYENKKQKFGLGPLRLPKRRKRSSADKIDENDGKLILGDSGEDLAREGPKLVESILEVENGLNQAELRRAKRKSTNIVSNMSKLSAIKSKLMSLKPIMTIHEENKMKEAMDRISETSEEMRIDDVNYNSYLLGEEDVLVVDEDDGRKMSIKGSDQNLIQETHKMKKKGTLRDTRKSFHETEKIMRAEHLAKHQTGLLGHSMEKVLEEEVVGKLKGLLSF